jgi:nucleotide-binding universal stress UspA family protein
MQKAQTQQARQTEGFSNVLLATDFSVASQAAFAAAVSLCAALSAKLTILHVFEYASTVPPEVGEQLLELETFYAQAQASLAELQELTLRAGIECEAMLTGGLAYEAILDTIREKQVDLAVLGTNALHGFERLVFGSTAETVLRKASCPVLTVGPRALDAGALPESDAPVVFATDFHMTTIHAVRYAASFCELSSSPLHCLHVLPRTLQDGKQSHIIPRIMTEALQHVAKDSVTSMELPVCAIAYGSEVSNAIVDYARQQRAKLIVLGVREASIAASHVPAHIAYRVIAEATCPVLTMAFASHAHPLSMAACF